MTCLICDASTSRPVWQQNNLRIDKCAGCGVVFTAERPSEQELMSIYDGDILITDRPDPTLFRPGTMGKEYIGSTLDADQSPKLENRLIFTYPHPSGYCPFQYVAYISEIIFVFWIKKINEGTFRIRSQACFICVSLSILNSISSS